MRITFLGAADTVTGSEHLVRIQDELGSRVGVPEHGASVEV